MEKLLKYCLSLFCLIALFSCEEDYSKLTPKEQHDLAEKVFKTGPFFYQGSPETMSRIERAIQIDPTYCDAVRELSVAYLKRGMPHKWKIEMDKAVACDPAIWQPYRGYNYLWFYRDYKKAIADFNASDTLTPNFIDAPQGHSVDYWRGIAYLGLKDYKNSIFYFDKYIDKEIAESGEDWVELTAFLYRGIAYYESNNFDKALYNFNKLIQYAKQTADGKFYKALILKQQNNNEEALEYVNDALKDFNAGYFNERPYVEVLRQIYIQDLEKLKIELETKS